MAHDAKAGFFNTARIQYKIDAGKLGQPLEVIRVEGRQVAYEQIASSPLPDQSVGTLVIEYPHPTAGEEWARVTFSVDSGRDEPAESWNPLSSEPVPAVTTANEEVHEVWAMSISRAESDGYFQALSTQNFYEAKPAENGPAELAVDMDGRELRKSWEQVPELNLLAQRVRREGQLVGYLRPRALAGLGTSGIASTRIYREMLAHAERTNSSQANPAGSLAPLPRTDETHTAGRTSGLSR